MNIDFFKTFLNLSYTGSYSKTAEAEYMAQSTISSRIIELEKNFQCKLFQKDGRKVVLTQSGKLLLPYAEKIVGLASEASTLFANNNRKLKKISIGSVHGFFDNYLGKILEELVEENPGCSPEIILRHSKDVIHGIISGKYKIGCK